MRLHQYTNAELSLPAYIGRYRICEEIDRGSCSTVVLALDEELESYVALKILTVSDAEIEKRFLSEARLLRRVSALNVVTVHDIGRLNDARPYFVLNYADRGTLAARLPYPKHLLDPDESGSDKNLAGLQSLLTLVDGVSAIQASGLIHRDIKPGNILIESLQPANIEHHETPVDQSFSLISTDERAKREQLEAKRLRQASLLRLRRNAMVVLLAQTIGAVASSVVAYKAYRNSQQNEVLAANATREAETRFTSALGAAAFGHYKEDPRLSLVLAAESMAMSGPSGASFDTRAAMISARQSLGQGGAFLLGSPHIASDALAIALNPQGSLLAVASTDGVLELIDTSSRQSVQAPVVDHVGGIRDVEFSPDGDAMVSVGTDGTLRHWQPDSNGQWTSKLLATANDVIVDVDFMDVDFMPDGESVISTNDDGTLRRYYLDGRSEQPLPITDSDFGF